MPSAAAETGSPARIVVVTSAAESVRERAIALARSLSLGFRDTPDPGARLRLVQTETRLELHDVVTGARLYVEHSAAQLRRYRTGGGRDPLRRALGPAPRCVVDATAGLGRDTVHLATLGYRVVAIEREPVVAALACDGLARARSAGLLPADNPLWRTGDARRLLPALDPAAVVYLDPMFPPKRKKSAATRKEMLLLRLFAPDEDPGELLALARTLATERVVVKRPLDAPPLAAGVTAAYRGKLIRYDVYRTDR